MHLFKQKIILSLTNQGITIFSVDRKKILLFDFLPYENAQDYSFNQALFASIIKKITKFFCSTSVILLIGDNHIKTHKEFLSDLLFVDQDSNSLRHIIEDKILGQKNILISENIIIQIKKGNNSIIDIVSSSWTNNLEIIITILLKEYGLCNLQISLLPLALYAITKNKIDIENKLLIIVILWGKKEIYFAISHNGHNLAYDIVAYPEDRGDSYIQGICEYHISKYLKNFKDYLETREIVPYLVFYVTENLQSLLKAGDLKELPSSYYNLDNLREKNNKQELEKNIIGDIAKVKITNAENKYIRKFLLLRRIKLYFFQLINFLLILMIFKIIYGYFQLSSLNFDDEVEEKFNIIREKKQELSYNNLPPYNESLKLAEFYNYQNILAKYKNNSEILLFLSSILKEIEKIQEKLLNNGISFNDISIQYKNQSDCDNKSLSQKKNIILTIRISYIEDLEKKKALLSEEIKKIMHNINITSYNITIKEDDQLYINSSILVVDIFPIVKK